MGCSSSSRFVVRGSRVRKADNYPGALSSNRPEAAGGRLPRLTITRLRFHFMSIGRLIALTLTLGILPISPLGARQRTHRREATPSTVAYGYYWSEARPVLRIASGDIVDVDTLLTSTPDRIEKTRAPPTH